MNTGNSATRVRIAALSSEGVGHRKDPRYNDSQQVYHRLISVSLQVHCRCIYRKTETRYIGQYVSVVHEDVAKQLAKRPK